jgi:hypothetical protein
METRGEEAKSQRARARAKEIKQKKHAQLTLLCSPELAVARTRGRATRAMSGEKG